MGDVRRTKSSNQKSNNNYHPTDATKRMLQLEATNAALQTALSSKNAHITMLEERLLKMSVEFASSRAREDEQNLKYRRSTQADDGIIMMVPTTSDAGIFPNPIRNTKISGRRRRGSRGSSVSPCPTDHQVQAAADLIDASIKSAPPPTQQTTTRRFSIKSSSRGSSNNNNNNNRAPQDDLSDSARSLGSTGVCNFIGNIINNIDRSDRSDDLNVNFPTGRRRSSMMSGSTGNNNINNSQPQAEQRRESIVEQLFRLRNKSELTADDAVEEICEQEEEEEPQQQHEEEEEEEQAPPQRRRPNRSNMLKYQASTRLLSSTLIFPKEDDDDSLGFE